MTRLLPAIVLLPVCAYAQFQVLGERPPDSKVTLGQPVEQRDPIGKGQKPAFPQQTRAAAAVTKTPLQIDIVSKGLRNVWAFAFLPPGDRMLITEKPGSMRIMTLDGKLSEPLAGVPKVVFRGDAGLLDVALHPQFAANRTLFFSYVEPADGGSRLTIARAKLSTDEKSLEELTSILRVDPIARPTAHYGSRLLFDKSGYLFVTVGERFFDPMRAEAQSLGSMMGKILRITSDGKPAPGNPFASTEGALPEIWSLGVRNPQGIAFHPLTGDLWETEHGPQGGDEVNLIQPGKNYGWPQIAYGLNYEGTPVGTGLQAKEGMVQPRYYWDPAIAPSGITFYSGKLIPEWKNNLFVTALAGQHVARLIIEGDKVAGEERLLLDQHQRIRAIAEGPDGALWIGTDDREGRIIRISPAPKK